MNIPADPPLGNPGPAGTISLPSCQDAFHLLTHLYLELRLPPESAVRAAHADCQWHADVAARETGAAEREEAPPVAPETAVPAVQVEKPYAPAPLVLAAFAAVYIIWGSTYLAIRLAIGTIPPFLMAGVRFLLAGGLLLVALRLRGAVWPRGREWATAAFMGAMLLLAGNGGVTWAEQRVPSALAALLIATVPLWMILLEWLRRGREGRPAPAVFGGLAVGFLGVALIVFARDAGGRGVIDPLGVAALLVAAFCWALGSVYSKNMSQAANPLMAVAAQMLCGGAMMGTVGLVRGELADFRPELVSRSSLLALLYLIFIGALVGYSAYAWLLRVSTPAKVSTYAYVNPFIAVVLGASLGHEPITGAILLAGALIIGAVVLITTSRGAAAGKTA